MKQLITKLIFLFLLACLVKVTNAQVTYVDLNIDQPDVANCLTGIETNFNQQNLSVFPNPTRGIFTLKVEIEETNERLKIAIYNLNGKEVFSEEIIIRETNIKKQIDLSGFPTGTYLLHISSKKKYYYAEIILN